MIGRIEGQRVFDRRAAILAKGREGCTRRGDSHAGARREDVVARHQRAETGLEVNKRQLNHLAVWQAEHDARGAKEQRRR